VTRQDHEWSSNINEQRQQSVDGSRMAALSADQPIVNVALSWRYFTEVNTLRSRQWLIQKAEERCAKQS
jgi:hypothetical protein